MEFQRRGALISICMELIVSPDSASILLLSCLLNSKHSNTTATLPCQRPRDRSESCCSSCPPVARGPPSLLVQWRLEVPVLAQSRGSAAASPQPWSGLAACSARRCCAEQLLPCSFPMTSSISGTGCLQCREEPTMFALQDSSSRIQQL